MFNDPRYRCAQVYFFAFDLLRLDGQDVRDLPLFERKQRLATSASDRTVCTTCPTLSVGCRLIKIASLKSTKSRRGSWQHQTPSLSIARAADSSLEPQLVSTRARSLKSHAMLTPP